MTQSESVLWEVLRGRGLAGYKFRRQAIVSGFVVDFWCPNAKLAIEVGDGPVPAGLSDTDGIRVVRVPEVTAEQLPAVVKMLLRELRLRKVHRPARVRPSRDVTPRRPWTAEALADIHADADKCGDDRSPDVRPVVESSGLDIAWRVVAMRPQYAPTGPIPVLQARPDEPIVPGDFNTCVSCAEPLGDDRPVCRPCLDAKCIVLGEHR